MSENNRKVRRTVKKKKRYVNSLFFWLILVLAVIVFMISLLAMPMIPKKWSLFALIPLLLILAVTFVYSSRYRKRTGIKIVNSVLAVCLYAMAVLMPVYSAKIADLFDSLSGNKVKVSLYVMNEEYRAAHPDLYANTVLPEEITGYADSIFITTVALDYANQSFALSSLKEELGNNNISTIDRRSVQEAAASLYEGEGDVLILTETYINMLRETEEYGNFEKETQVITTYTRTIEGEDVIASDKMTTEPFTVFFGGNDEEGELILEGRTDVDMTVTVNPNTHQILIANLPRDSFVDNPALGNMGDKLTHLGIQGIGNTLEGLSAYYDEPINNYILINFTTYEAIIDALGGVDVDNPYAFGFWDSPDVWFEEGTIHLDGNNALMYVRERKTLPDGDFGRNMHQQLVMQAIIEKVTSPEVIVHFNDLLNGLQGTFLTNISSDSIYALCRMQLDQNISWNIVTYHAEGLDGFEECASAPGYELSVIYPYPNQVAFIREQIDKVVNGDIIEQLELPEGTYDEE